MQPTAEKHARRQMRSLAGQVDEHRLGRILRQSLITVQPAQGGAVDQVHVARDNFAEGGFGSVGGVLMQ